MIGRSFQARIAVPATLLAGVVVLGFGGAGWMMVRRVGMARIDEEVTTRLSQLLSAPRDAEQWERIDNALMLMRGGSGTGGVLLRAWDYAGGNLYQSPGWPADLDSADLPVPPSPPTPGNPPPPDPLSAAAQEPPPRREPGPGPRPVLPGDIRPPGARFPGGRSPVAPVPGGPVPGGRGPWRRPGPTVAGPPPRVPTAYATVEADGNRWRIGIAQARDGLVLAIGVPMNAFEAEMAAVRNAFLLALLVALGAIAAGSWWLARRALRPVRRLAAAAERVTAAGLDERLGAASEPAEFERLIRVFNEMLERLKRGFEQATRFSSDASHELKTPLAVMQGELEQALYAAEDGGSDQQTYSRLLDEVHRLKTIASRLLLLSRADAGRLRIDTEEIDLSEIAMELAEDAEIETPDLDIDVSVEPGVRVRGDSSLLTQAFRNLVTNAQRYNREGGGVRIALGREGDRAVFRVANTGPGIAAADRARVFDRFYRADAARSTGGSGLGLSISREIARAHGGNLLLEDPEPEHTTFAIVLPLDRADAGRRTPRV